MRWLSVLSDPGDDDHRHLHLPFAGDTPREILGQIARHDMTRRLQLVLGLSAVIGIVTGLAVAGFERVVHEGLFEYVLHQNIAWIAISPLIGLIISAYLIREFASGDARTTDAYVASYHERGGRMLLRRLPARVLAAAATLGMGGAYGYEGPAIFIGGSIGSYSERRFTGRFRQDDAKVLMVAGAAAGVAAVFKAPLTGIIFALEVPYTQDLARRALLPSLVAAGTSYLTFVTLLDTQPIFRFGGTSPFDRRDLIGGVLVGVLCGVLARMGAWGIYQAKSLRMRARYRTPLAGIALCGLAVLTYHLYDSPISLGSGYEAIDWAQEHNEAVGLLVALFALRYAATWLTAAGCGVGGLFIPLVTQGAILGIIVQAVVHAKNPGLFPTVGIAAFLGGGYRTPLAGVAFVAEATGQAGFVVPALLAAAASQIVMGRWSFSPYQRGERDPDLVPLDRLLLREVMSPNPDTVAHDLPLDECAKKMMADQRRWVPVLDNGNYAGLLALTDVAKVPQDEWPRLRCGELARRNVGAIDADESVATAARHIREADIGAVAVTEQGKVVGVVTIRDIANVERLLDRLASESE